jgi:dTDP-4-amino-4,6-dideoxygalactose transaminase
MPEPCINGEIYNYLKMMSLNGQTKDALSKNVAGGWKYDIIMQGMKINMPDICAAIGLGQIKTYSKLLAQRKILFNHYIELFQKYSFFELPPNDNPYQTSSYHLFPLRIRNITEYQRDLIIEEMTKTGIAVNVHFIPMPMLTFFKSLGYRIENYPVSYDNYSREISLPIYPQLSYDQVEYIVSQLLIAYNKITGKI